MKYRNPIRILVKQNANGENVTILNIIHKWKLYSADNRRVSSTNERARRNIRGGGKEAVYDKRLTLTNQILILNI